MDKRITDRIVRAAGDVSGCRVCEVGPGPGNITRPILERGAKHVVVIEKDSRFLPSLELLADACPGRLSVIHGDVMQQPLHNLFPDHLRRPWRDQCPDIHLIGNLPFNISTPLIIRFLHALQERRGIFSYGRVRMTLTFQREVAERMVAPPMCQERCRLSVMCQHLCKVELKFLIPGSACVPKPDVDIGVVRFTPLITPEFDYPFKLVEKVARHLFHGRQKHCKRGIATLFPEVRTDLAKEVIERTGVNPEVKGCNLSNEEIGNICGAFHAICQRIPKLMFYDSRHNQIDIDDDTLGVIGSSGPDSYDPIDAKELDDNEKDEVREDKW